MISQGHTTAVFQFESDKMTEYLRAFKPKNLEDLTAMNALYRPGPMDNIPEFIERRHGRKPITYIHPLMEQRLQNTYGIIAYQEQVMQLVQDLAGFSIAQSDVMRRAMGKKDDKMMAEQRSAFINGALSTNNIDEKTSGQIFDLFQKFASYAFNKSHSVAYSYLAFQTAWLKKHYTAEFLAANMTSELNNLDRITTIIDEARKFGIRVLPPDVNRSELVFRALDTKTIVFGLAGIKNLGVPAVESILKARVEQPFTSFFDFVSRVDVRLVNKRALEALVAAGAFDSLKKGHRAQMFESIDFSIEYAKKMSESRYVDMDSLFGDDVHSTTQVEPSLPVIPEWSESERLEKEYFYLNFYVSGHPLQQHSMMINSFATLYLSKKDSPLIGKTVRVCGMLSGVRTRLDKKDKTFASAAIEDMTGKGELIIWGDVYAKVKDNVFDGAVVVVSGRSEMKDDSTIKIVVDDIVSLRGAIVKYAKGYSVRLDSQTETQRLRDLSSLCVPNGVGGVPVAFQLTDNDVPRAQYHASNLTLNLDELTARQLAQIFGKHNVKFLTH
jgi:DNA polymerase-3 subunit alpha